MMMKYALVILYICMAFINFSSCVNLQYSGENEMENKTKAAECKCMNGYCEVDKKGKVVCKCPLEFGVYTKVLCKKCECGKGANCTWNPGFFKDAKYCICKDGYKDIEGTCKGDCSRNPCKNGGVCRTKGNDIFCDCKPSFSGEYCENSNGPCIPNPCRNNGVCELRNGKASCKCESMFTGDLCEINTCEDDTHCEGNKKCLNDFCDCEAGKKLDPRINLCRDTCGDDTVCVGNKKCLNNFCDCETGKKWDAKNNLCKAQCEKDYKCMNEGECKHDGELQVCFCKEGISGVHCEIIKDCLEGGSLEGCVTGNGECKFENGAAKCVCPSGKEFDTSLKECRKTCDETNICAHDGACTAIDGGNPEVKFCHCKPGTKGDHCRTIKNCEDEGFCGTKDGVVCMYDGEKGAICMCADSEKLFDPVIKECRKRCDETNFCENGAECKAIEYGDRNAKFCQCRLGTKGDDCRIVKNCEYEKFCGTKDGVECKYDGETGGICACVDADKLFDPAEKECRNTCEDDTHCEGNKKCLNNFCDCEAGRKWDATKYVCRYTCEDDTHCEGNKKCLNNLCDCEAGKKLDPRINLCREQCGDDYKCINEGECKDDGGLQFCSCKEGTSGVHCEIIEDCLEGGSLEGCVTGNGECKFENGAAKCVCFSGKEFDTSLKECRNQCGDNSECMNEGDCKDYDGLQYCACEVGTSGDRCEIIKDCLEGDRLDGCVSGNGECKFENGAAKCVCSSGKEFDKSLLECRKQCGDDSKCLNEGECKDDGGLQFCSCTYGTSGDHCEIIKDCLEGGSLEGCVTGNGECKFENGAAKCVCSSGKEFDKSLKECRIDHCTSNPCKNGGLCRNKENTFECTCFGIYGGNDCSENIWCDKYGQDLCGKEKCQYNETLGRGYCVCENDTAFNEASKSCVVDHCFSNPCKNGGFCRNIEDTFECTCARNYKGSDCSENIWCDKHGKDLCGKETCQYDETRGKGFCQCEDGKMFHEPSKTCVDTNTYTCTSFNHWSVNWQTAVGTCENEDKQLMCYNSKKEIQDITEFFMLLHPEMASRGIWLSKQNCSSHKFEECLSLQIVKTPNTVWHYFSHDCEKELPFICCTNSLVDHCDSNPCKNGGSCQNKNDTFECTCAGNYGGNDCSENIWCEKYGQDLCGREDCQYNETLKRGYCICEDGKVFHETSKTCIKRCFPNPCKNGGMCNIINGNIHCSCDTPYSGDFCEKDPCTPNPCHNGGTCTVRGTVSECSCTFLYSGGTCDIDNRFMTASILVVIFLMFSLMICGGYCMFKINQNLKAVLPEP